MRAVGFRAPGGPQALELLDVPEPDPGDSLLLVETAGAAVNPVDLATRSGQIPTSGTTQLGWDLAGTVVAAPAGSGFVPGDRVAAMTAPLGTGIASMAERVAVDPGFVAHVPHGLDLLIAAALPLAGVTAAQTARLVGAVGARRVLLAGAQGSVGSHVADQLLEQADAHVDVLVRPDDAEAWHDRIAGSPADGAVVTSAAGLAGDCYDVVVDAAGVPDLLRVVVPGGRFVTITPFAAPGPDERAEVEVTVASVEISRADLLDVLARAADGRTCLPQVTTMGLDDAVRAHTLLESGGVRGKIVLVP